MALLDSQKKRVLFLKEVKEKLNLPDIEVIHGRAETFGRLEKYRESFNLAICRAVGKMATLVELALPFLKTGGLFLAMKGPRVGEEIAQARRAIELLNGKIQKSKRLTLPFNGGNRTLILIEKQGPAPAKYPRRPGIPKKRPL